VKYCIIRKVPFKMPGRKSRILWANVLAENQGLALVIVPKPDKKQPHSIFFATENITDHVFEAVGTYRFDIETMDVMEAADKLRMLGKTFFNDDFMYQIRRDFPDDF
jgi:hypothetical protein